jgi:RNA polymerase subunit RPABC4/transcription elongation factor Spt4
MEFEIICPVDGTVTVSLEDIDTVVIRDVERADITFVCPECGTDITVTAVVPSFLLAAIEALAENGDDNGGPFAGMFDAARASDDNALPADWGLDDPVADAYCEYFRRQLSHVDCVDDMLAEIDSTR